MAGFKVDRQQIVAKTISGSNAAKERKSFKRLLDCLALGVVDLTNAACKMTMDVIAAVAEFERDLLVEGTYSGLMRAKAQGKTLGASQQPHNSAARAARIGRCEGKSLGVSVKEFGVSRSAIQRVTQQAYLIALPRNPFASIVRC